jgi:hypothetical protein
MPFGRDCGQRDLAPAEAGSVCAGMARAIRAQDDRHLVACREPGNYAYLADPHGCI